MHSNRNYLDFSENILQLALREPGLSTDLELLRDEQIPVSDHTGIRIRRYSYGNAVNLEDTCMAVYEPLKKKGGPCLDLYYCLNNSRYCTNPKCIGGFCEKATPGCALETRSADVFCLSFSGGFFGSFPAQGKGSLSTLFDPGSPNRYVRNLSVCGRARLVLDQILHPSQEGILRQIYLQGKSIELLLCSTECLTQDREEGFSCRFLANPEGRQKITRARDLLVQNLDEPLTIRELARKVAINECYLKKGFKEIYGTTIYDYFQKERMEKARQLLYENGLSVSQVASSMGYSCISHFSTAFRKHTGLKPCELLLR